MSLTFSPASDPVAAPADRTLVAAFLDYVPDHIQFKDRSSRFLALSRSLARYLGGRSVDEIIGRTLADFCPPEIVAAAHAEEERVVRTGQPVRDRLECETGRDGRTRWFVTHRIPLRDAAGGVIGTFGVRKDVTRQKEMESALAQARRDLLDASRSAGMAEIANGILHNVGNVLNSLNVSAAVIGSGLRQAKADSLVRLGELLRSQGPQLAGFVTADPKGRQIPEFAQQLARHAVESRGRLRQEIQVLQKNIDHIKEIVAMQQRYAKVGGVAERLEPAALLADAVRMSVDALQRHDLDLVCDYGDAPTLCADRAKVVQILVHLIGNAQHACDAHGASGRTIRLSLATTPERDRVRFVVADNGAGISAAHLTRIFAHGFTTRAGGHGFGLHAAANAAREMKGSLTAASPGPGAGATFTLDLPAA